MGRAALENAIGRLDAVSRTRALDLIESGCLARLVSTAERYERGRRARGRPTRQVATEAVLDGVLWNSPDVREGAGL